jgi:FkbM family methyltransferase
VKNYRGIVLYGVGNLYPYWVEFFRTEGIPIIGAIDRNPTLQGQTREGILVSSVQQGTHEFNDCLIFITPYSIYEQIAEDLIALGVRKERLFYKFNDQYFAPWPCRNDEVYIDAGTYDGHDVIRFNSWCHGSYKKVYAIEPEPSSMREVKKNTLGMPNIEYVLACVGEHRGSANFRSDGTSSRVDQDGTGQTVEVMPIDDIVQGDIPTLIKMDIEGFELAALHGAQNMIRQGKPRLAICVYHKPEDILEIPQYLLSLVPEYRFFLRHHSVAGDIETVLYAYAE